MLFEYNESKSIVAMIFLTILHALLNRDQLLDAKLFSTD